jgi:hypothetical protein
MNIQKYMFLMKKIDLKKYCPKNRKHKKTPEKTGQPTTTHTTRCPAFSRTSSHTVVTSRHIFV